MHTIEYWYMLLNIAEYEDDKIIYKKIIEKLENNGE